MNRLISVIVPIYNVERYLRECIDSLIAQTFTDFELILVNDGSPDNSLAICLEYAGHDNRVRVIDKPNGGLSDARNVGIELAAGEYLCFVDSDDYVAPKYLETMLTAIRYSGADVCICDFIRFSGEEPDYRVFNAHQTTIEGISLSSIDVLKGIEKDIQYCVSAWNKLYRKEVFSSLRYPKGLLHEDNYIFHRIFYPCKKVCCLAEHLYFYRERNDSIMGAPFSPRRFDDFFALRDRIAFYEKNNLRQLLREPYISYMSLISTSRVLLNFRDPENRQAWRIHKNFFNSYWIQVWRSRNLRTILGYYIALASPVFFHRLFGIYNRLRGRR